MADSAMPIFSLIKHLNYFKAPLRLTYYFLKEVGKEMVIPVYSICGSAQNLSEVGQYLHFRLDKDKTLYCLHSSLPLSLSLSLSLSLTELHNYVYMYITAGSLTMITIYLYFSLSLTSANIYIWKINDILWILQNLHFLSLVYLKQTFFGPLRLFFSN